jgi:putative ABC transport system ATP-binding protein
MMSILEVRDVKKSYQMGKVIVQTLKGVSFNVEKGEFLTIFGPSGNGKSTLLHLLGGLDRPDEGEIIIDGSNILKLSESKTPFFQHQKVSRYR